jgi:signal transduction histidine kinase
VVLVTIPASHRLRRAFASPAADAVLAAGLLALGESELLGGSTYDGAAVWPGSEAVNGLLVIPALTLPLALRRTRPLAAFLAVAAVIATSSAILGGGEAVTLFLVMVVAVYSGAANAGRPMLVAAVAAAAATAHVVFDPHVKGVGDVVFGVGLFAVAWVFGLAVSARQRRIASLEHTTVELAAGRAEHAREAVSRERSRIARELHDVVAHAVSVIVVQSQGGQRTLGRDEAKTRAALEAIEATAREALDEMRRLLLMLRETEDAAETAPQPGLGQIEHLAGQFRDAGLPVAVVVEGDPVPLPAGLDLSAYRVVQEGLTNALKHGGAEVRVVLRYGADELQVEVLDAGGGPGGGEGSGHGLLGMRERVSLYGGVLESGPGPGGGWRLSARLPLGAT